MTMTRFSILLPTWNNLAYLQKCVESVRKNSRVAHQIILHINDGSDGTFAWAQAQHDENLVFTHSPQNVGICHAVNQAAMLATEAHLLYLNDDMYVLPDWDMVLSEEIMKCKEPYYMFSATMIEPRATGNRCTLNANYGESLDTFEEEKVLLEYKNLEKKDWSGASFPPLVVSREAWAVIGGFSIELSPGMYSDPDFSMKLWAIGCRTFKGLGASRVYHFQAKSTGRVKKNNGRLQFMQKWGVSANYFYRQGLRLGEDDLGKLPNFEIPKWQKIKMLFHQFCELLHIPS
jgi:GT2 family glycosyltransferase